MQTTVVVTAKIIDKYMTLIDSGVKRFEVRDEPFHGAQFIRYVSASDGHELGFRRILDTFTVPRSDRVRLVTLSAISEEELDNLFPRCLKSDGADLLWVAHLGDNVKVEEIFNEGA